MKQELRFLLDLGWLTLLKKKGFGPIMINFFDKFFQVFIRQKDLKNRNKNIVVSAINSCMK